MFDRPTFEPAAPEEIETSLAEAIRASASGQMTRSAEVFLAGVCAEHLTVRLLLAGFVFMRRADGQATAMAAVNASARSQRVAILASPLAKLTESVVIVDCAGGRCGGERSYTLWSWS
jgi:hypothetical protein